MRNKPINILYVSNLPKFIGGAPRSLYELLKNIDRRKIKPYFASIYNEELAEKIKELEIPFLHLKKNFYTPPFFSTSSFGRIVSLINKHHIHLIHNNQCDDALYTWLPAKITNIPIIIHHRDPSFYKRHKWLSRHVDANIAISSWQNKYNLNGRGIVIHNGIQIREPINTRFIDQFNKDNNKIIIGLLGRIMPYKAQDIFIKAAPIVLSKYNQVEFLVIGDDHDKIYIDYINHLKSLVINFGIQNSFHFTGYIDDCWKILPFIDISVIPSRKESFGRVIIESMACQKPVIATNIWGALDIVTPETGLLIDPEDPYALAEAILYLIHHPDVRKKMGQGGRKRVEEYFTIDKTLLNIYKLYNEIISVDNKKIC